MLPLVLFRSTRYPLLFQVSVLRLTHYPNTPGLALYRLITVAFGSARAQNHLGKDQEVTAPSVLWHSWWEAIHFLWNQMKIYHQPYKQTKHKQNGRKNPVFPYSKWKTPCFCPACGFLKHVLIYRRSGVVEVVLVYWHYNRIQYSLHFN